MESHSILDSAIAQIHNAAASLGVDARRALSDSLRALSVKLENTDDTIFRIIYGPLELACVQVGVDLGIFKVLVNAGKSLTITEIASQVNADVTLVGRLLRFYQSYLIVDEEAKDTYKASNVTEALTSSMAESGVKHQFHFITRCIQEMPDFLRETKYANPNNVTKVPFSKAYNTDLMAFAWVQNRPFELGNFVGFMSQYHKDKANAWTSVVPFSEHLASWTSGDRPLYVDVGGGMGAQAAEFQQATKVPGRIVLEDLGPTLAAAPDLPGIEKLEADFFQPQPIKGAKYYYLRNILHDHPDHNSVKILNNIKDVMAPDSIILINEMVVPDVGAHSQSTQLDLTMMSVLAAMERTKSQWYELLEDKAGLKINAIHMYEKFCGLSVIECIKP